MLAEIPISKGAFKTPYTGSLRNNEFAENLINLMIGAAGENVDRPTLSSFATLSSPNVIGSYAFGDLIVFVTDDRRSHVMTSAGYVIDITGELLNGAGRATFADDGETLYIAGGGEPLKWVGVGHTTELLGGTPPNISHLVFLDGYLIGNRRLVAENNKVVQWADYEDTETWDGLSIFSAISDPYPVSGLAVAQRELYVVGERNTEVWQNIGTSPVPFARAFVWQFGTTAPYSIVTAAESVLFIDRDRRIMQFTGRSSLFISEAITNELASYSTVDDCWASWFIWNGRNHVLFVFPTAGKAWSFDMTNSQWSEWRGFDVDWERAKLGAVCYSPEHKKVYAGDYGSNAIYTFSDSDKTDAGGTFKRVRTFSWRDQGASIRKQVQYVRVNMNRRVATAYSGTEPLVNPTIELRWRDEGKAWVDWRQAKLGEIGESRGYACFNRLGIYRKRQYEIQMSDPAEMSIASVETDEEPMAS